jgi:MoxR-like ATPase
VSTTVSENPTVIDTGLDADEAVKAADAEHQVPTPVVTTGPAPAPSALAMTPDQVRTGLHTVQSELSAEFFERGTVIEGLILAMLAKEHAFILGPPGTAKSALTRAFFARFPGAEYFEAILSKTRPAEAILGPYDIPQLRDKGHLYRKINGFLPTAHFAMLDEVGKMSPTLGHDLLAVILERRLHQVNGGRSWYDVPLYSFIGGSNELPTEESDDAAALWDRLLVRLVVDYVNDTSSWVSLLSGSGGAVNPTTVDFASLAHVIDNEVPTVRIPHDVLDTLVQLRELMRAKDLTPSDRRWKQCMKLLRASAWLDGRDEAVTDDIAVLRHALWENPTQIAEIERMTLSVSNPFAEQVLAFREKLAEIVKEAAEGKDLSNEKRAGLGVALNRNIKTLIKEASDAKQVALAQGASTAKFDELLQSVGEVRKSVYTNILDIDVTDLN